MYGNLFDETSNAIFSVINNLFLNYGLFHFDSDQDGIYRPVSDSKIRNAWHIYRAKNAKPFWIV